MGDTWPTGERNPPGAEWPAGGFTSICDSDHSVW